MPNQWIALNQAVADMREARDKTTDIKKERDYRKAFKKNKETLITFNHPDIKKAWRVSNPDDYNVLWRAWFKHMCGTSTNTVRPEHFQYGMTQASFRA